MSEARRFGTHNVRGTIDRGGNSQNVMGGLAPFAFPKTKKKFLKKAYFENNKKSFKKTFRDLRDRRRYDACASLMLCVMASRSAKAG